MYGLATQLQTAASFADSSTWTSFQSNTIDKLQDLRGRCWMCLRMVVIFQYVSHGFSRPGFLSICGCFRVSWLGSAWTYISSSVGKPMGWAGALVFWWKTPTQADLADGKLWLPVIYDIQSVSSIQWCSETVSSCWEEKLMHHLHLWVTRHQPKRFNGLWAPTNGIPAIPFQGGIAKS